MKNCNKQAKYISNINWGVPRNFRGHHKINYNQSVQKNTENIDNLMIFHIFAILIFIIQSKTMSIRPSIRPSVCLYEALDLGSRST